MGEVKVAYLDPVVHSSLIEMKRLIGHCSGHVQQDCWELELLLHESYSILSFLIRDFEAIK
jgi:hypothetical protein